jgi:hypothetical protein
MREVRMANCAGFSIILLCEGGRTEKVKTTIIALSAAALIAAAPAVLAQSGPSKSPGLQHKVSKKNHSGVSVHAPLREMQAKGPTNVHPRAFGYARGEVLDRETEMSRQAGGGGGGGSGM